MTLVQITNYTNQNYTDRPQVNIHCIEHFFTVRDFWATCACPEKTELPWKFSLYWIYFLHLGFLTTRACPENSFPWNFLLYWIYFLLFRIFKELALALKNRVALEFFTVLKYFLSFRIFEQLALALKNRVCPEFFHCMEHTFHIQNFEQVALALKNRVALELSLYWICIFYHSGFLSNLRLPWKTELPWNFSLYWIYFLHSGVLSYLRLLWKAEGALNSLCWICIFYFQEFWATCACPEKQSLPWKFSSPGGRQPRPPASYAYDDICTFEMRLHPSADVVMQSILIWI